MTQPLLKISGLTKRFTGTLALDAVDLEVERGEIHALLGENGAGKSTLIKILAGVYTADGGTIALDGAVADPQQGHLPISFIHQDLGLVGTMTVAENIALLTGYPRRSGLIDWPAARRAARAALATMGAEIDPEAKVATLAPAERSLVAIARALAIRSDLLVLDEPTAALPEADVARLLDALQRLRAAGIGIIYVTHRLDEVFRIADRVTVLRDGKRAGHAAVSATSPADLVVMIIGRPPDDVFVKPPPPASRPMLAVRDLVAGGAGPVSFDVAQGEILGLVGLRGAGHATIGRALFGDQPIRAGGILLEGVPLNPSDPRAAMERGVGFVSAKRMEESLAPMLTVRENLYANPLRTGRRALQLMGQGTERRRAGSVLARFSVRPRDPERPIATLSGGNQQKVVVARWMEVGSRLLILEEPTFGVDVGSKAEIYRRLQTALDAGTAVLLISSDFEEVAGISHRALVFDRGRIAAELSRAELSTGRITAIAAGALPPAAPVSPSATLAG